jgi:hypothetical protein
MFFLLASNALKFKRDKPVSWNPTGSEKPVSRDSTGSFNPYATYLAGEIIPTEEGPKFDCSLGDVFYDDAQALTKAISCGLNELNLTKCRVLIDEKQLSLIQQRQFPNLTFITFNPTTIPEVLRELFHAFHDKWIEEDFTVSGKKKKSIECPIANSLAIFKPQKKSKRKWTQDSSSLDKPRLKKAKASPGSK